MSTASWDGTASKIPSFINDLFSSNVRALGNVQNEVTQGGHNYSFCSSSTRGIILNAWLAAWQQHQGDSYNSTSYNQCPSVDRTIIGWLSDFIKTNALVQYNPDLDYVGPQSGSSSVAVYKNNGYKSKAFLTGGKWNYGVVNSDGSLSNGKYSVDTVANFLTHLFYGAHFVVVSNSGDRNGGNSVAQFWNSFVSSDLDRGGDKFNSHYSGANTTGYYYLNIYHDKEPSSSPLLAALLVALTDPASSEQLAAGLTGGIPGGIALADAQSRRAAANTFIQLEGWQNHFPYAGGWHAADYDSHKATLWNFSTFGACCYSEKRCTPIFLANSKFNTALNSSTKMPLYNGAASLQSWMETGLLQT
jgi:hypothetical protein